MKHTFGGTAALTCLRNRFRLETGALAQGLIVAALVGCASGQIVPCGNGDLDANQSAWSSGLDVYTDGGGVEHGIGQVFRVSETGVLDELTVVLRDMQGGADITPRLDLYAAAGPLNPKFNKWFPVTTLVAGPAGYAPLSTQAYTFHPSGVTVQAGNYYALVITGGSATPGNALRVFGLSTGNAYPDGRSFSTSNTQPGVPGNATKALLPAGRDLAFQACIVPQGPGTQCPSIGRIWVDMSPPNYCSLNASVYPAERMLSAMAYDRVNQVAVMFGGYQGNFSNELADTWYWDGQAWIQDTSPNHPAARAAHAMAWDPNRGTVVLYGGQKTGGTFDDMWEWLGPGAGWSQIGTGMAPGTRSFHAMAFDMSRDIVVLTAGRNAANAYLNDTWEWDGSAWTQASGALPSTRIGHAMAYHPSYSRGGGLLTFGGWSPASGYLNETLLWAPSWLTFATVPARRFDTNAVYDTIAEKVVLFGGATNKVRFDDTWVWDDQGLGTVGGWTMAVPSPNPGKRDACAMAYDELRDEIVLFGGQMNPATCPLVNTERSTWVAPRCPLDMDGDWVPNTPNDQAYFMNALNNGDACADCNHDGTVDLFDLVCFQQQQQAGCP